MSVFHNNALIGAGGGAAAAADFQIDRSLRFNQADSANLSRTLSSSGNRRTWSLSWWMKLGKLGSNRGLFGMPGTSSGSPQFFTRINTNDRLYVYEYNTSGTYQFIKETEMRLRDPSAWYHCVFQFDSTQSAAEDGFKIYINGTRVTTWATNNLTNYAQNYDGAWNSNANTGVHKIGLSDQYFDGYFAEIHFVDGLALAASDFGEYDDNNVWQPKQYSGTYGTNGFKLDFSDNSSVAALGTDSSGNSNTFTVNNFTVTARDYTSEGSTSGSFYTSAGGAASKMFDGDASTGAFSQTGTATFTFGGSTITASSSLKVRAFKGDSSGANVLVNGTNISSLLNAQSGGGYSTVDITSTLGGAPINLSNVSMVNAGGGSGNIAQIFVDDVELVDASDSDIDSLIDTPTNYTAASGNNGGNYCTLNPLTKTVATLSNGNLLYEPHGSTQHCVGSTFAVASGKWYWEYTIESTGNYHYAGIADVATDYTENWCGSNSGWTVSVNTGGDIAYNGAENHGNIGTSRASGQTWGWALDMDAGTLKVYINGTIQYSGNSIIPSSTSLAGRTITPAVGHFAHKNLSFNFGQRPFKYTPPTNHLSLCSTNLPDPAIADGSTAFLAKTFTANASNQTITTGFSPDLVWVKSRANAYGNELYDIVRGPNLRLTANTTAADQNLANQLTSFNSDGFTLGNASSSNYTNNTASIAWAWDAGSSTVSNTQGSITTNVRASQTNGFSIATYTGNGSANQTLGHSLGAAPAFVIIKDRSSSQNWAVLHTSAGTLGTLDGGTNYKLLELNANAAARDASYNTIWHPTNTTVKIGEGSSSAHWTNKSGDNYVMYAWTPVEGFSAFGSYEGDNSTDGPFVYTGFRPEWVLIKNIDSSSQEWVILDAERNTFNVTGKVLYANTAGAEADLGAINDRHIDILSNGFKVNRGDPLNQSATHVFACFASHPFKTARAR